MQTPRLVLGLAGLVFAVAVWGFYTSEGSVAAREREERLANAREAGAAPPPSLEVDVLVIEETPAVEILELAGVLAPVRATWVSSEIAGRVIEIAVQEYSSVQAGDLLIRLDSALPEAELIRARASHALAQEELERQQRLGSRSVASQAELERAQAEERRSYATLLEARTRLAHTRINAPFDGLVNALDLDPGTYVQPGTPVAEILDISRIEVSVLVGDRQITALAPGAPARVRVDPLGNEVFEGRIVRVGRAPQQTSQRYPAIVELANPEERLLPGMLAHVQVEIGTAPSIRVPTRAVLNEFELDYLFVLDAENRIRRARIATRPVPFRPDQVEILQGVEIGDRVVVSDIGALHSGQRVLVR